MATKKISELNALTTPESDDLIAIVDASATETKKITYGNISKHIVNVGTEVEEDSRVNFIHSRNLFDKNNVNVLNAYFVDGANNITADTSGNNKTIYIPCKPNTTYTIQKTASPSNRAIGYTTTTPAVGVAVQGATNISANTTTGSITTGNNARYLVIRVWSSSQDTITYDQMIASVQIEEGTTATPYKSFTTNEINVDNEKYTDTINVGTNVDNRSRVNFIRQVNNILPKGTIYTLTDGSVSLNFKVPKANTQYTMKTNLPATDGLALVFFGSGADAQVNSATNGVWVGSPRTMTSDANGYVTIAFRYLSNFSSIKLSDYWYTLAEGTLGVDYIVPSINVDGETIVNKNVYSSNEVVIGEWLGKPLYRKVVEITNPTLDAWTNVNHNISNMDFGRIVDATITRTIYGTTSYIPIGVSNISAGTLFTCDLQKTIIEYKIAGYTNITNLTIVLEYTKSTD